MPKRWLTVPHVKQKQESDCLAACAAMMLEALAIDVPYSQLLKILDIAPWGTPHRNIKQLAEKFTNLEVIYKQGTLLDLFEAIDADYAVVVFVWTGDLPYWTIETWHAVVVTGYDDQNFFLNDPAYDAAPQTVSHGDLDLAWLAYDSYFALLKKK